MNRGAKIISLTAAASPGGTFEIQVLAGGVPRHLHPGPSGSVLAVTVPGGACDLRVRNLTHGRIEVECTADGGISHVIDGLRTWSARRLTFGESPVTVTAYRERDYGDPRTCVSHDPVRQLDFSRAPGDPDVVEITGQPGPTALPGPGEHVPLPLAAQPGPP